MSLVRVIGIAGVIATAGVIGPALAQPWGWGPAPPPGYGPYFPGRDPREGRIQAAHFAASGPAAAALGHGSIAVQSAPGSMTVGTEDAAFQSAVAGELARAGYRTDMGVSGPGQVAELVISHALVQPPEPPHSPISGEVEAGGGGRYSGVGVAIGIDLTKPRGALIATRLDARIRDSATHELLWEGHADVVTRDRDRHWSTPVLASRLAAALFKDFPRPG